MIGMTGKFERLCWGADEDGRGVDDPGLLVLELELRRWGCALEASCGLEKRDRVVNRPRAIERVEERRDIGTGLIAVIWRVGEEKKREAAGTG